MARASLLNNALSSYYKVSSRTATSAFSLSLLFSLEYECKCIWWLCWEAWILGSSFKDFSFIPKRALFMWTVKIM